MENYEAKLLSFHAEELPFPKGYIPFGDLASLVSITDCEAYEQCLRKLADQLPYKTSMWPSFGQYVEDWYRVEVGAFKRQLLYCERGSCDIRQNCENLIDLSYHVLDIVSPNLTPAAAKIAQTLDRIEDQRLLIWLRMSSEIYHAFLANNYFGQRRLSTNVAWMCAELVRMGVAAHTKDAFGSRAHIVSGLRLGGLPTNFAENLYQGLENAVTQA